MKPLSQLIYQKVEIGQNRKNPYILGVVRAYLLPKGILRLENWHENESTPHTVFFDISRLKEVLAACEALPQDQQNRNWTE